MVNGPSAPKRIAAAHASDPDLPIGLHLNLTAGRPVLTAGLVPHLVGTEGAFHPVEALLPRLFDIPLGEIRAEIAAQARLLIDCGVRFDHIDYHQHILALNAPLFDLVADLAETYRVPVRQPFKIISGRFRIADIANLGIILREMGNVFTRSPRTVARFLQQVLAYRQLKGSGARLDAPDCFINTFFRDPTLANFTAILRQLPPGLSELVVHPALEHQELYSMVEGYRAERARELKVLLDPRARAEVDRQAIHLTDFSSVRRGFFQP